jgi:protein TonB
MFDQTFVGTGKTNKSWTVMLSCIAEFAAIGVMILVPIIWTEVLPKAQLMNTLTVPAPPPPPLPPAEAPVARRVRVAPRAFNQGLAAPSTLPQRLLVISDDVGLPPSNVDVFSGIPDLGLPTGRGPFVAEIGIARPAMPTVPSTADVKPTRQEAPLPVGGNVQSAKLIKAPAPTYPAIAKSARIQGTVVLQAIIGKDGSIRNLKVLSAASPLLVSSAMDAVKQWVYRPTLLNQEPVEVITEITVNFALR